ncbi:MAG: hypothetical protein ACWGQW_10585, partial [bacterium]
MATYDGLAVPLYGDYSQYTSSQTAYLAVGTSGQQDFTFTSVGADNLIAVTVTDSNTVTSGYLQSFYTSVTTSGSYTTGNTQINAFAVDLLLGGTVGCEAEGFYAYIAKSGSPTLTSANISGMVVYIDDLGGAPSSRSGIQIHIADGNAASGQDAFITMRLEGGSGAVTSMFQKAGTANNPTYFLSTNATNNMLAAGDYLGGTPASAYGMKCYVNGTVYYIPLVT